MQAQQSRLLIVAFVMQDKAATKTILLKTHRRIHTQQELYGKGVSLQGLAALAPLPTHQPAPE